MTAVISLIFLALLVFAFVYGNVSPPEQIPEKSTEKREIIDKLFGGGRG